jgi:hypothetical protein
MMFTKVIDVYSENHIKPINTLCGKMQSYLLLKQVVYIVSIGV